MTYGQFLKQEAIQEDRLIIAKNILKDGESMEKVIKWTGINSKTIEKNLSQPRNSYDGRCLVNPLL